MNSVPTFVYEVHCPSISSLSRFDGNVVKLLEFIRGSAIAA